MDLIHQPAVPEMLGYEFDSVVRLPAEGIALEEIERQAIVQALRMCWWVQKDAAEMLHISPRVMNYKIRTLGIVVRSRRTAMAAGLR
jgi:transcriptional regulator with GAF, ATPase, and Fis domain